MKRPRRRNGPTKLQLLQHLKTIARSAAAGETIYRRGNGELCADGYAIVERRVLSSLLFFGLVQSDDAQNEETRGMYDCMKLSDKAERMLALEALDGRSL